MPKKGKKDEKYIGKILPKSKKRLDGEVVKSIHWTSKWVSELKFEVAHNNRHIHEKFVVDLQSGSCSCKFWGVTSLPYELACSVIFYKGANLKDFISNYYTPGRLFSLLWPCGVPNKWGKHMAKNEL